MWSSHVRLKCVWRLFSITLCFPGLAGDCESISELPAGDGVQNWRFSSMLRTGQLHWHLSSNTRFYWTVFSLASKPLVRHNVHSTQLHSLFKHTPPPKPTELIGIVQEGKKIFVLWGPPILSLSVLLTGLNHQYDGFMYRGHYGLDALRSTSQMISEAEGGP